MTQFPDLFAALASPFDPHEVKVRSQAGRNLSYITARTAMNRLDDCLGPENWWDDYHPGQNSVICRLTVRLPDGSTVTKADAGGYAGMSDSGDDDKSGFSDSFKRASAKFGVGRYLYGDGIPSFVRERETAPAANGHAPNADAEDPTPRSQAPRQDDRRQESPAQSSNGHQGNGGTPRTGRALFAWTKGQEEKHQIGLLKYLNEFIKLQDFPGRMVDLDAEQVGLVYTEACRKIQAITGTKG